MICPYFPNEPWFHAAVTVLSPRGRQSERASFRSRGAGSLIVGQWVCLPQAIPDPEVGAGGRGNAAVDPAVPAFFWRRRHRDSGIAASRCQIRAYPAEQ